MSFRLSRILEVASATVQILSYLGLPLAAVTGIAAGMIAWAKALGGLASALVALFVLASVLHIVTSLIYIVDRVTDRRRQVEIENAALHYQLTPLAAALIRDEANQDAEYQLRLRLYNSSVYPIRYIMVSFKSIIDDRVNPDEKTNYVPGIVPASGYFEARGNSYARGRLSKPGLNRGTLELVYRYGHASKEFVFEARRVYALRCILPSVESTAALAPKVIPVEMVVKSELDTPI